MSDVCRICGTNLKGLRLVMMSAGTFCMECANNVSLANTQPMCSSMSVLWVLAETFFRKGKGENVTFEEVWDKNNDMTGLVKREILWKKMKPKGGDDEGR